jgi:hypothetical protein
MSSFLFLYKLCTCMCVMHKQLNSTIFIQTHTHTQLSRHAEPLQAIDQTRSRTSAGREERRKKFQFCIEIDMRIQNIFAPSDNPPAGAFPFLSLCFNISRVIYRLEKNFFFLFHLCAFFSLCIRERNLECCNKIFMQIILV